ncbi:MAG: ABC transporter ATP-binding protein [Candidatus Margulisbacteria bacterium]|nr:ABC transporter ATP-binding protein [Candidatus Margulisiibacteriota bacterium]
MNKAIEIKNIFKTYHHRRTGDVPALEDVSLNIEQGSFFGLIGPNGAGKSTLIKIITGLSIPNSGTVLVGGFDVIKQYKKTRQLIGVSLQEHAFDPYLLVEEELYITGGYFGKPKAYLKKKVPQLLQQLALEEKKRTFTDKLSGGMKRRLAIAKALIHDPEILILDEPTAGLDVQLRHELWEILQELNNQGKTILLTTHYLEEVEHLCNEIAIINKGKIIYTDKNKKKSLSENSELEQLFMEMVKEDEPDKI